MLYKGCKFYLLKVELLFKDDVNNDPQWSGEQFIATKFCLAGFVIGQTEMDIMSHVTQLFLKYWRNPGCPRTMADVTTGFSVDVATRDYSC